MHHNTTWGVLHAGTLKAKRRHGVKAVKFKVVSET